jgi:iron complex transport system substrate-binding protein
MISGCVNDQKTKDRTVESDQKVKPLTSIKYASRFNITYYRTYKKIRVNNPWPGSTDTLTYIITTDQQTYDAHKNAYRSTAILQPLDRVVCFSTTHLPHLELIGLERLLCGFPTTNYIYSEKIREMVQQGDVKDLGPSNDINLESLIALNPDLVFAFSMGNEQSMIRKIQLSGIPLVLNADYLEDHPLGRAEWIKFVAAFFNKDQDADSIFNQIEKVYLGTKTKMEQLSDRPTVFTGVVYGDTWFLPGGKHYGTVFFNDAGGNYLWSENESDGILQLSFESVYEKAREADLWIGTATYNTLKEIEEADIRYSEFKAFINGNVYNYSAKINPKGGNAYFELGYARPDIILNDLAKILHPAEMKDHQFYFYKKLY